MKTQLPIDDLEALGNLGMLKAFNTFDLSKGLKFATYAARVMNNEILMELRKSKRWGYLSSLDNPVFDDMGGDKEMTILDMAFDESVDIEKQCENSELIKMIKEHGKELLSEREYACILNFLEDSPANQAELADRWEISQSYVSRITKRALFKVRQFLMSDETKPVSIPKQTEKETIMKERKQVMKTQNKIALIPGETIYEKVKHLYLEDPNVTAAELADKLGANKASMYTYLNKVKKEIDGAMEAVKRKEEPVKESVESKEPVVIFNDNAPPKQPIPIYSVDKENPEVIEPTPNSEPMLTPEPMFVPEPEEMAEAIGSPSLISLSMKETPSQSLQFMLNQIANILQESESYDLTINITKNIN